MNTIQSTFIRPAQQQAELLELSTGLREISQCREKKPTRAFFLLKVDLYGQTSKIYYAHLA